MSELAYWLAARHSRLDRARHSRLDRESCFGICFGHPLFYPKCVQGKTTPDMCQISTKFNSTPSYEIEDGCKLDVVLFTSRGFVTKCIKKLTLRKFLRYFLDSA